MKAPDKIHAPFITKEVTNPKSPHRKKHGGAPYRRLIIGYRVLLMDSIIQRRIRNAGQSGRWSSAGTF
jgi:hypothetical protein